MRALALAALAVVVGACGSTPPEAPYEPGVRVELALVDGEHQPPVFRWDAPVARSVTVRRGDTVIWEIAEGDVQAPDGGLRRGPIPMPLIYGQAWHGATGPAPRTLASAEPLLPQRSYSVTVVGYDGAVFEGRFTVQARIEPLPYR